MNTTSSYGTAVEAASSSGHIDILQLLLEQGAYVKITSSYGTALQRALSSGDVEEVKLIL